MAGQIPAVPGEGAYASAKPSRVAGTNFQVDDPFHGRSDTGGPRGRGSRLSEALQSGWYKCSG